MNSKINDMTTYVKYCLFDKLCSSSYLPIEAKVCCQSHVLRLIFESNGNYLCSVIQIKFNSVTIQSLFSFNIH